ncbi:uncharacterized protein LOC128324107 [Hemicordylus capensis]|uniref:uncharacterized protein LOC128324107 n=1 Tax=Hemicordylus capensis TaxID=884348 RepID=UPI0023047F1D|nr:uncharacterized protein LOC128324107 [Hemicordylus capensis]XP_053104241.1 uncharacterized protein LOC128324107 [Hemicordylus capensis]XP_053104242.1 uncharacterized protein LOC128324107 [Hemicordylus capensis]
MDKRTYHACFQFLVACIILQPLQAADDLPTRNEDFSTTMATPEARQTAISRNTGMSRKEAGNSTILHTAGNNWNATVAITVNVTSFSTLSPHFAQSTHSPHAKPNSPSAATAETKTGVTTLPTESSIRNSTYQATTEESKVTTSAVTWNLTVPPFRTAPLLSSKALLAISASPFPGGVRLNNSETILTAGFAIILALTILGFLVYILDKHRKQRNQYSHYPLYDGSSEIVDRYATPDDTLVISGGLYDAPRIYNPDMMVYEDDELQTDHLPFSAQLGQFRLEFLPDEKEKDTSSTYETFQIPPGDL